MRISDWSSDVCSSDLNNALTYRDRRLRGFRQLADGWVSFCAVCSVGLVANVGVAAFLHDARSGTWAASALVGVLVGAVWNYALSSRFTWGRSEEHTSELQSLMRISYAVFCLKKKKEQINYIIMSVSCYM